MRSAARVPFWWFALLNNTGNALLISLPFVLRKAGLSLSEIANLSSTLAWPSILFFLWSPLLDVHLRRRTWTVLLSLTGAFLAVFAFALPLPVRLNSFSLLLLMYLIVVNPITAAAGALASVYTPSDRRGSMGGWLQAGNLGAGAMGAALVVLVAQRFSIPAAGWVLAMVTLIPAFIATFIPEPPPASARLRDEFARLWANLMDGIQLPRIREGIVIFLCPTGAAALTFLFSGLGPDYHAGAGVIAFSNGPGGGLLAMGGALVGGLVAQRLGPGIAYAALGLLSAATAFVMMLGPVRPITYAVGSLTYSAVAGCCYAAFSALALDLIGENTGGAAGWYAAYSSLANVPISYMTRLDGVGYAHAGSRGMLGMDAALSAVSSALMLAWFFRRKQALVPISR